MHRVTVIAVTHLRNTGLWPLYPTHTGVLSADTPALGAKKNRIIGV
jgi:hypothetical protein